MPSSAERKIAEFLATALAECLAWGVTEDQLNAAFAAAGLTIAIVHDELQIPPAALPRLAERSKMIRRLFRYLTQPQWVQKSYGEAAFKDALANADKHLDEHPLEFLEVIQNFYGLTDARRAELLAEFRAEQAIAAGEIPAPRRPAALKVKVGEP